MKTYLDILVLVHKRDILRIEGGLSELDKVIKTLLDGKAALVIDWQTHLTQDN